MAEILRIAIDGPSGAGKSTIAKLVAKKLGVEYVDTGAMYRAVGYKMKNLGIDPEDMESVERTLAETEIDFDNGVIRLDGEDVSGKIRTPELAEKAIAEGTTDMVMIGRALLCDPHWARKAEYGKADQIRPCLSCRYGCLHMVRTVTGVARCVLNP